jgi:putative ABC transport system substrate-binding protein
VTGKGYMREILSTRASRFVFENRKSEIQNPKWMGLSVIAFVLVVVVAAAEAQQPAIIPRVGYLSPTGKTRDSTRSEAIRLALRELGYIEGQNIASVYRYAEGKRDRAPELAADLVRLKVDIIVAVGGDTVVGAAMNATKTIPIVMMGQGIDPVEAGFVKSLAHPGGNVTGFTNLSRHLGGKRLEVLKDTVPNLELIGILYDPSLPGTVRELRDVLPPPARALGLTIQPWEIRAAEDFHKVFGALQKQRPDGLYILPGPLINDNYKPIVSFASKNRIPSVYGTREAVELGGLMHYGADLADSYRRVATYVDKILKGAKPRELPVEQSTKFELVINVKAARQIGLAIPPSVLARADKVIK